MARLFGLLALAAALLFGAVEGRAELDPYFFLRNRNFSKITPRILFVVDVSGSMTWKIGAGTDNYGCDYTYCEGSDPTTMSRIKGARDAISAVVQQTSDQANFALMSFDLMPPPSTAPSKCNGQNYWFYWTDQYSNDGYGYRYFTNQFGSTGTWSLCEPGYNVNYNYLRWDDLGFTDPSITQTAAKNNPTIPPGPLFSPTGPGTEAEFTDNSANSPMRWRKLQVFGNFMGPRFHVDCTNSELDALAKLSVGDYSYAAGEICGHDFYYWPYVDGFVGYSRDMVYGSNPYNCSGGWSCPQPLVDGPFSTCVNTTAGGQSCTYTSANAYTSCSTYASGGTPGPTTCAGSGCSSCPGSCCCDAVCSFYGDCCPDYNTFCPIQPLCSYTQIGNPFSSWAGSTVDYFDCNYYAPNMAEAEAACGWIGQSIMGDPEACKVYGSTTVWGSSCGADEGCCENVAIQAGLPVDACKSYSQVCPVPEEFTPCATYTMSTEQFWAGVQDRDWVTSAYASVLAPFYFEEAVTTWANSAVPADALKAGPLTKEDANARVYWMSRDMAHGGIDVDNDTPWSYTIGTIPATPPDSNAPYSHPTVASYLKYVTTTGTQDSCVPTYTVVISDGIPSPGYGGTTLLTNLAALRNTLGVKVYVVGFGVSGTEIDAMACAGAGAATGCLGTPADNWDTCKTVGSNVNCAFVASNTDELASALVSIVTGALDIEVPSGPGSSINTSGLGGTGREVAQTKVTAYTEYPSWKGHVREELCGDEDPTDENPKDGNPDNPGTLAPWCEQLPFHDDEKGHATFGPCTQNTGMTPTFGSADSLKVWDAGECLRDTSWTARRIYSHDANNQLFRITAPGDPYTASWQFKAELEAEIGTSLTTTQANAVARFIMGEGWPGEWKLPGLAMSAPIVARRIPKPDPNFIPTLGIRDPHCAGRVLSNPGDVPKSLLDFAHAAWETTSDGYGTYYEYQEAVVVGDDLGVIHAFQLASGNELFGLIPRFALKSAYEQSLIGAAERGQPEQLADHKYGVSATINQGWVWDDAGTAGDTSDDVWRHLALIGMGVGGTEFIALDLSHMGRLASNQPVDVLWTTDDATLKVDYDAYLGETWSRPALTYRFEPDPLNEDLSVPPKAYVLMGSGYQTIDPPDPNNQQGRRLWLAEALTGKVEQFAILPPHDPNAAWDANYGMLTDIAVGTHCISRYWAEMQEAYIADPFGRLFRWDLFYPPGDPKEGESDSGQTWKDSGMIAKKVWSFGTCMGAGATCNVQPSPNDPFFYGPALVANNRIDDPSGASGWDSSQEDQFLVGLVSGNMNDDATNEYGTEFHSSVYILADDHTTAHHAGISIPTGSPKRMPGTDPDYMRMAITDIDRARTVHYPDGSSETTTAKFKKGTRPLRAPRMNVFAVADEHGNILDDIEVIIISFYFYEPADQSCDPRWRDPGTGQWTFDSGSSYEVSFRLTVDDTQGFDLVSGSGQAYFDSVTFGGAGGGAGLIGPVVTQVETPECESGACGPKIPVAPNLPCDPNENTEGHGTKITVPMAWSEITGFTPVE